MATALERARASAVPDSILFGGSTPRSGGPLRRAVSAARSRRTDYQAYLEQRHNAAEAATRGNLVSREGRARGVSADSFFTGKPRTLRFATPELREWFQSHGTNLTPQQYRTRRGVNAPRSSSVHGASSSGS